MIDNENKPHVQKDEQKTKDQTQGSASSDAPTTQTARSNLNDAAQKAGVLAGKAFAMGKAATKDIAQELKNVNDIRKQTVASAEAGTTKKELAKGFCAKLSGKQKGIAIGITMTMCYLFYSLFISSDNPKSNDIASETYQEAKEIKPVGKYCGKVSGLTLGLAEHIGGRLKVDSRQIEFLSSTNMKDDYWLCPIRVHTSKGPQNCSATDIILSKGKYLAHGMCM